MHGLGVDCPPIARAFSRLYMDVASFTYIQYSQWKVLFETLQLRIRPPSCDSTHDSTRQLTVANGYPRSQWQLQSRGLLSNSFQHCARSTVLGI